MSYHYRLYIIYPQGDTGRITVSNPIDTDDAFDYSIASKKEFFPEDREDAIKYAIELALKHNKLYIPNKNLENKLAYLD